MTNSAPKLSDARAAAEADALNNRPAWFNVEEVTGLISAVTEEQRQAGTFTITEYVLHFPQPRNLKTNSPISGEVTVNIAAPVKRARNYEQQAYFYTVEAAAAIDPTVEDIYGLAGKEWTLRFATRKPFATATTPVQFYNVTRAGGASAAPVAAAFTKEDLYAVYEGAQNLLMPDAVLQFGQAAVDRVLIGTLNGEPLGFKLKTVEGKLVAEGGAA